MKILIGTKNPGKIEGAKQAFEKYFDNVEIEGVQVSSNVGDQPINEEILQGAKNRVKNLKKYAIMYATLPHGQAVRRRTLTPLFISSNLIGAAIENLKVDFQLFLYCKLKKNII